MIPQNAQLSGYPGTKVKPKKPSDQPPAAYIPPPSRRAAPQVGTRQGDSGDPPLLPPPGAQPFGMAVQEPEPEFVDPFQDSSLGDDETQGAHVMRMGERDIRDSAPLYIRVGKESRFLRIPIEGKVQRGGKGGKGFLDLCPDITDITDYDGKVIQTGSNISRFANEVTVSDTQKGDDIISFEELQIYLVPPTTLVRINGTLIETKRREYPEIRFLRSWFREELDKFNDETESDTNCEMVFSTKKPTISKPTIRNTKPADTDSGGVFQRVEVRGIPITKPVSQLQLELAAK